MKVWSEFIQLRIGGIWWPAVNTVIIPQVP